MPTPKSGRRQLAKPNLNVSRHHLEQAKSQSDPASPPDTPTTWTHRALKNHPLFAQATRAAMPDARIHPTGNGHQFSYRPFFGPEQLSPRSSSSFEGAEDSDDDGDDDYCSSEDEHKLCQKTVPLTRLAVPDAQSASEEDSEEYSESDETSSADDEDSQDDEELGPGPNIRRMPKSPIVGKVHRGQGEDDDDDDDDDDDKADYDDDGISEEEDSDSSEESEGGLTRSNSESPAYANVFTSTAACDFTVEEMDPMDSDEGLDVLQPYEIKSNPSQSSSRLSSKQRNSKDIRELPIRELPIRMMQDLKNLNCSNEASDDEVGQDTEEAFYKWQQHMRRRRVSVTSSIGKRTFSERSDSDDSDDGGLDVNEVGSSARRMKKRIHRGSLLFQDPPEPRIDELDEPNSSEDEYLVSQHLGMELPYWTIEINEVND